MKAIFYAHRDRLTGIRIETYKMMGNSFAFHATVELVVVCRGRVRAWIGDAEMMLSENEIAVVLSNEAHQFKSLQEGEYVSIYIPTFLCPDFIEALKNKTSHFPVVRDARAVAVIRHAMEMLEREDVNAVEEKGYIYVMLGTILRWIEFEETTATKETDLPTKLLFYINEHYKEDLPIDKIAQALGYSSHHLSDAFRACFHVGIGNYINTLRLKNAVMLMREKKNITESAMESGFGSLRTFYRVFAEEFGCAPREFLHRES